MSSNSESASNSNFSDSSDSESNSEKSSYSNQKNSDTDDNDLKAETTKNKNSSSSQIDSHYENSEKSSQKITLDNNEEIKKKSSSTSQSFSSHEKKPKKSNKKRKHKSHHEKMQNKRHPQTNKKEPNTIINNETKTPNNENIKSKKSASSDGSSEISLSSKSYKGNTISNKSNKEENSNATKAQNEESERINQVDFTIVADGIDVNQKSDRFGWAKTNVKPSKKERKYMKEDDIVERRREMKWAQMTRFKNWNKFYSGKYRKKLEERVMKGIPDCMRGLGWRLILDPESLEYSKPFSYSKKKEKKKQKKVESRPTVQSYYDIREPPSDFVIRVDIPRTMPRVPVFTRADMRTSLYRILRAYSNADPELEYFQGMQFPAAILRLYMEETDAFWSFYQLMSGKNHRVRDYYINEFENLKTMCKVWDYILEKRFPPVHERLHALNINHMIYTTSWFLTAFMNINFLPVLKLRIFDRFALFGTRALISLGLAIIDIHYEDLSSKGVEIIVPILQNPCDSNKMQNLRHVIKYYDKNFLTQKQYNQYFKDLGIKVIP